MPRTPSTEPPGAVLRPVLQREKPAPGGEFVRSLSRGLALLCAFDENHRTLTISEAADAIGVDRATARRLLLTLVEEEFAGADGAAFYLRPRALQIGFAYMRSSDLAGLCQQHLQRFSDTYGVTASAGVLADGEALYIARSVRQSPITVNIEIGAKVPLYRSSIGRVLLAAMDPIEAGHYLKGLSARRFTDKSLVTKSDLESAIHQARESGYAIVDEELELSLRTVAVPVRDSSGRVAAALNVATIGGGVTKDDLVSRFLVPLQKVSQDISLSLKP